ncbi:hypothetical protein EDB80DRAFT_373862 [Ilyonectria destructans]|nr:hypothetical protein EDB80DRAFT_373862 [Ilyonectria destructans]
MESPCVLAIIRLLLFFFSLCSPVVCFGLPCATTTPCIRHPLSAPCVHSDKTAHPGPPPSPRQRSRDKQPTRPPSQRLTDRLSERAELFSS